MYHFVSFLLTFLIFSWTTTTIVQAGDCEAHGLTLKVGESKTLPGKCNLLQCNSKGSDGYPSKVIIKGCPNAYAPPHCKFVPVNLNKAYPDCCPHWDCDGKI